MTLSRHWGGIATLEIFITVRRRISVDCASGSITGLHLIDYTQSWRVIDETFYACAQDYPRHDERPGVNAEDSHYRAPMRPNRAKCALKLFKWRPFRSA